MRTTKLRSVSPNLWAVKARFSPEGSITTYSKYCELPHAKTWGMHGYPRGPPSRYMRMKIAEVPLTM